MKMFLYSHGGSGNHGCEAIVRGTVAIFDQMPLILYSNNKDQDKKYGINQIVEVEKARKSAARGNPKRVAASLAIRILHNDTYATKLSIEHMLNNYGRGDIGLSIGGDNYCYPGFEETLAGAEYTRQGVITDGAITTARGMGFAVDLGLELVGLLVSREKESEIRESIQHP